MENELEIKEKGCVYFFRHIGLTPVKIGYSSHESPIGRFEQFSTYAPYGSEILNFIISENAKELESILHERFSSNRLKGEWFEITENEVDSVCKFYNNQEEIKRRNEFYILYSKSLIKNYDKISDSFEKIPSDLIEIFNGLDRNIRLYNKDLLSICNYDALKIRELKLFLKSYCIKNDIKYVDGTFNNKRYFKLNTEQTTDI